MRYARLSCRFVTIPVRPIHVRLFRIPGCTTVHADRWTLARTALIASYIATLATLSILKWAAFKHFDADLAINDQLVWNASRGHFFASTLIEHATISLGDHFAFFQVYLAPLYWIVPGPRTLLTVQSIALGITAVSLGWLADLRLKNRALGTAFVAAFLLYPALHNINLFEYHEVIFAVPVLAALLWSIEAGKSRITFGLALLALTVKEEMALVCLGVGVYILLVKRQWKLGALIAAMSAAWAVVVMGFIMPALSTAGSDFYYVRRYSQFGSTSEEIIVALLTHPGIVLSDLLTPERLTFYAALLGPLALLPALSPAALLLAAVPIGYLALGNSPAQYSILYHYPSPIVPLVFVAAIAGAARLLAWRIPSAAVAAVLLVASAAGYWLLSPLPGARGWNPDDFTPDSHTSVVQAYLARVPADVPVSAGRNLVSRLSERDKVYNFPTVLDAQAVLLDYRGQVYPGFYEDDGFALRKFLHDPAFWLVSAEDGVWFFERGTPQPSPPQFESRAVLGDQIRLLGYDLAQPDAGTYRLTLHWQAQRPPDDRYAVFIHVLNEQGERVWQEDSEPFGSLIPTVEWQPGRDMPDLRIISLKGLPPGRYRVLTGMYGWGGGDRLPVRDGGAAPFQDTILVAELVHGQP